MSQNQNKEKVELEAKQEWQPVKGTLEKLLALGNGLWIAKVHVNELREQDSNARVMAKSMFEQLAKNIGKRGHLESLPYCAETEKGVEIVSGHHRVRAARAAGIETIYIILDTNKLTKDEIIARQLAHNSTQIHWYYAMRKLRCAKTINLDL